MNPPPAIAIKVTNGEEAEGVLAGVLADADAAGADAADVCCGSLLPAPPFALKFVGAFGGGGGGGVGGGGGGGAVQALRLLARGVEHLLVAALDGLVQVRRGASSSYPLKQR